MRTTYRCRCGYRCETIYQRQSHERRCQLLDDGMEPTDLWVGISHDCSVPLIDDDPGDPTARDFSGGGGDYGGGGASGDF